MNKILLLLQSTNWIVWLQKTRFILWCIHIYKKVLHKYWRVIPYNYRPLVLWYRLKCYLYKRYSTIKPRTLPHTWCDKDILLTHCAFEILSKFIEEECSPEIVDWKASNHTIEVNGEQVNVRDEMQYLYDWWHNIYLKEYDAVRNIIYDELEPHKALSWFKETQHQGDIAYMLEPKYASHNDQEISSTLYQALNKLDIIKEDDIQNKLHRLVNIRPYMWT